MGPWIISRSNSDASSVFLHPGSGQAQTQVSHAMCLYWKTISVVNIYRPKVSLHFINILCGLNEYQLFGGTEKILLLKHICKA
jgi:hypothetical protein